MVGVWGGLYTVTRAIQNEALFWKIVVLGMKKNPCWLEHFASCP
jgi:hypothetical protein